ncbi:hypothetical protein HJG60_008294 [Phyllostomus discolor]|uniref:Uncharacterized protein n=1 Tax=Phyllostomus discolor TaxID=89673 RepID=A0A833Z9E4_9CHIR|nr:hypothetical protein HJG60_008294 [Phyllostomus discolor]
MPRSSPCPHVFLSQLCRQVSIPSGTHTCGFQSLHPLAVALSFRIRGTLSSASMQQSRKTCAVLHWVMGGSGQAHVPRVPSPYVLQRSRGSSAFPVPVQLQASPTNPCLVRRVPAQLHQLCCCPLLTPDLRVCSYSKPCGFPLAHQTA